PHPRTAPRDRSPPRVLSARHGTPRRARSSRPSASTPIVPRRNPSAPPLPPQISVSATYPVSHAVVPPLPFCAHAKLLTNATGHTDIVLMASASCPRLTSALSLR